MLREVRLISSTNSRCKVDRGAREEGAEAYTSYASQADRPSNEGLRSKWNWYKSSLLVVAFAVTSALASGCVTATEKLEAREKIGVPVSQVYFAKYEEVEMALKQAMIRYPQRVDNTAAGIFETDYIKGDTLFKTPYGAKDVESSNGYRYRLVIRLVKGRSVERPAVKVEILKQAELIRDFFSPPEPQPSNGLEEASILYRIGRELAVDKAIRKITERADKEEQRQYKKIE